jgi:hypothetical protein
MTRSFLASAAGLVLLLSACGSDGSANNAGGADLNAAAGVPIGNDASAMEIVGNQGGAIALPAPAEDNAIAPASNRSGTASGGRGRADEAGRARSTPPRAAEEGDSRPGGDRGGNAAQGNLSGI